MFHVIKKKFSCFKRKYSCYKMPIFILEKDKFHVKTGQLSCFKMYQTHTTSTHVFMHQLPLGGTIWSVSHWLPSSFWDSSGTQFEKSYLAVASEQEQAEHPAVLVIVKKKKQIFTACVILKSTLRNPCWFYQVCAQLCCDFHCMIYANRPEHLWRYSSAVKLFPYRK